jgi:arabinan endo-1,5-alpha-L-arabinosidase
MKNTSCIGVATNKTLDPEDDGFGWTDHGKVIQSVPGRDLWNAIDPNLAMDEGGTPWLVFGSFWSGMKMVKLDSSLLRSRGEKITYSFPPHSFTLLKGRIEK